jgi:hypothetical protein
LRIYRGGAASDVYASGCLEAGITNSESGVLRTIERVVHDTEGVVTHEPAVRMISIRFRRNDPLQDVDQDSNGGQLWLIMRGCFCNFYQKHSLIVSTVTSISTTMLGIMQKM